MRFIEFEDHTGNPVWINPDRIIYAQSIPNQIGHVALVFDCDVLRTSHNQLQIAPMQVIVRGVTKEIIEKLCGEIRVTAADWAGGRN